MLPLQTSNPDKVLHLSHTRRASTQKGLFGYVGTGNSQALLSSQEWCAFSRSLHACFSSSSINTRHPASQENDERFVSRTSWRKSSLVEKVNHDYKVEAGSVKPSPSESQTWTEVWLAQAMGSPSDHFAPHSPSSPFLSVLFTSTKLKVFVHKNPSRNKVLVEEIVWPN